MIGISYIKIIIKCFSTSLSKEDYTLLVTFSEHAHMIFINICSV